MFTEEKRKTLRFYGHFSKFVSSEQQKWGPPIQILKFNSTSEISFMIVF